MAPRGLVTPFSTPSCSNSITFSEYPLSTPITTQYSNKGILFGGDSPFISTDGANPTSPVLSGSPQFQGAIEGSFVDPTDGVTPSVAVNFQLDGGYFDSLNSTILKLYDSQGNLIGKQTNSALGIFTFTVNNLPVAKWRIESVGDEPAGFAIDNVCFNLRKLQSSSQSPKFYPKYLKDDTNATLASVSDANLIASGISQTQNSGIPQTQNVVPGETILQPNVNSTAPNVNAGNASLIPALSCQGIGYPLTDTVLFKFAKIVSPNISDSKIRAAFEDFALRSQVLSKYPYPSRPSFKSPERAKKTNGALEGVVPDAVSDVITLNTYDNGTTVTSRYEESGFWDAKTGKQGKSIAFSGDYQAQGYVDYLSHYSDAAKAKLPVNQHPVGHLIYMTTSDVGISSGIPNYVGETPGAAFTPVAVYQMVACILFKPSADHYIQMGRGILQNAYRFADYSHVRNFLPSGRPTYLKLP